ncbi:MAG: ATP-binding cassette domain-containing protein [Pseudomonadota bacterium]
MSQALTFERVLIQQKGAPLISLDARIDPGAVLTLMGPSGSGKSTLLAFATGTLDQSFSASGRILLGQHDITKKPAQERRIGMMFQDDLLFPHLSVVGNLAFGLSPRIKGRAARRSAVEAALAEAGLAGFADRDPATLSGGQRARVALMRVLLAEPLAVALDEPFSKLDSALRAQIREFVLSHTRSRGLPVVLVTHDPADADAAGGEVVVLGTPSEVPMPVGDLRRRG